MSDVIRFVVWGEAAPQGSKSAFVRGGKPVLVEGGSATGRAKHKAWRHAVAAEARAWLNTHAGQGLPDDDPLDVQLSFFFTKPKSGRKRDRWHTKKPDLDKLARAVLDGLSDGGLLNRDQRVASLYAEKAYADGHAPCCVVEVTAVNELAAPRFEDAA